MAYFREEGWKVATDAIKADAKLSADIVVANPSSVLEGASIGKPSAYGSKWIYWVLFSLTTSGQCEHAETIMPEEVALNILCLGPANRPVGAPTQSGRAYIESEAEAGFAYWIDDFYQRSKMAGKCSDLYVNSTTAGSEDEFGRSMFIDSQSTILWANSADVRVVL